MSFMKEMSLSLTAQPCEGPIGVKQDEHAVVGAILPELLDRCFWQLHDGDSSHDVRR